MFQLIHGPQAESASRIRQSGHDGRILKLKSKRRVAFIPLLLLVCFFPVTTLGKCIEGNCINGQGSYAYPDGSKYVGQFKDYMAHGQGTYTYPDG